MAIETGFLVIADISGYTKFTIQSEIEHAEGVMQGLIGAIVKAMAPPFLVSKLEGDAVFSYVPSGSFSQNQSLLESLEKIYFDFRDLLFQMDKNTSCSCKACVNMRGLDLKIVVHYGEYVLSEIAERMELSGPDVITVHRLLKNEVIEATGINAYCFLSARCAKVMELRQANDMIPHTENIDHIGPVEGYVLSLEKAWKSYKKKRIVKVDTENPCIMASEIISLSKPAMWDYMHQFDNWVIWSMTQKVKEQQPEGNRNGVGLKKHCVHGRDKMVLTIVDWRPFDYYTTDLVINNAVTCRNTVTLEQTDLGTKVTFYSEEPRSEKFVPKLILKLFAGKLRRKIENDCYDCLKTLKKIVDKDFATGQIVKH